MRDVVERLLQQALGPHLVDHSVHRGPSALKAFGECIHGNPSTVRAIDGLFRRRVQRPGQVGEQRLLGMLAVVVLDRVADRLDRPAQAAGDAPADLGQGAATDARQTTGPPQDVLALVVGHLREAAAALHAVRVGRQKAIDHRLQEADLTLAVGNDGPAHQTQACASGEWSWSRRSAVLLISSSVTIGSGIFLGSGSLGLVRPRASTLPASACDHAGAGREPDRSPGISRSGYESGR